MRNCNLQLSEANVSRGKFKVCLQYHIGNCLGPCENYQNEESYNKSIEEIKSILKGNIGSVISGLKTAMKKYSEELNFEEAQQIKLRLEILQNYQAKSTVVSPTIQNVDVYSFLRDDQTIYINFLKVVRGSVIHSFTLEIKEKVEENDEDILLFGITEIRQRIFSNATEFIVPFKPSFQLEGIKFTIPQRGDKKMLLELWRKT